MTGTNQYTALPMTERFWEKVERHSSDECWPWLGSRLPKGYGTFRNGKRVVKAHRFSWELHHGAIPDGLWVLHHCDNPPCVNPAHLFVGTNADNIHDSMGKGRRADTHGTRNPAAKVDWAAVHDIRRRYANGESQMGLGRAFGISNGTVYRIVHEKTWR